MAKPALVLMVRFKSRLPREEAMTIAEERAPDFEALPGLQQKYYLEDVKTGVMAGLYLWDSAESLEAYRTSELRASIAETYQAEEEPRVEVYKLLKTLREENS